jgi:hypothetical protein
MDLTFEFVKKKYDNGTAIAELVAATVEHTMITDWRDDPWADYFHVSPQN